MLAIVDFEPQFAQAFHDINLQWIEDLFTPEPIDLEVLKNPQKHLLDQGGIVLIALLNGKPVGAGALKRSGEHGFELTKMGVLPEAQGHKVGGKLLAALVEKAREFEASELYLLSSHKCEAAVHLYEKFGFVHDEQVMATHGGDYARCDVAMSYPLEKQTKQT